MMNAANTMDNMKNIKKKVSAKWFLWVIVGCVAMLIAASVRNIVLQYGYGEINGIIAFVAVFGFSIACYAIIVEGLFILFDRIFKQTSSSNNIVIDYEAKRESTITENESRRMAIEQKTISYIIDTMTPYLAKEDIALLIDNVAEFWHSTFRPEFPESKSVCPNGLTTTDLMHFGWNIARPFQKSGAHTAVFLKSVFADTFRNTEVHTIERKLRSNPNVGNITIDTGLCGCRSVRKTERRKDKTATPNAKDVALADMMNDDYIGNSLIDDEIVA